MTSIDPRSTHPKLTKALERLSAADLESLCQAPPAAQLTAAIHEFNARQFFEQHETLELLWRATPGEIRHLYEGILQIGVGLHHLLVNHNYHGAAVKLDHGIRLLEAFPDTCQGVDIRRLRDDARQARDQLVTLGPERMDQFDSARIPTIHQAG